MAARTLSHSHSLHHLLIHFLLPSSLKPRLHSCLAVKMMSHAKCSSIFLVILFLSFVLAVQQPELDGEATGFLLDSHAVYFEYPGLAQPPIDYYSHLGAAQPIQQQALQHAHIPGNGPFFLERSQTAKAAYASTQIRANSELGRRWNLMQDIDGQPSNFDAQAFWRIDRNGPKLLRLQLWPTSLTRVPITTMAQAINSVPRGFSCC